MNAVEKLEQLQNRFGVWTEADPAVMEAFGGLVQASFDNCAPLDAATLELLIVAVSVARKCEPCIYSHVSSYMAYSALALEVFDELKAAQVEE